jgi:hypothetical protein
MSYRHTIQAGLESLREIEQLLGEFSKGDRIPVELDLVLQKIRNLYEIMLMLRQHQQELRGQQGANQEPSAVETSGTRQADYGSSTAEIPDTERDREKTTERQQQTIAENPPMPEGSSAEKLPMTEGSSSEKSSLREGSSAEKPSIQGGLSAEGSTVPGESSAEKPSRREMEATILSERYSGRSSLYDSIQDAISRKDVEPIGQAKPVTNIKSAIGINDRFTYIRELFNNDATVYENTIGILDEAANFNEAYNYMIQHFDWDMDSETVQQLLDIIRRKYITGRHE